jgi:hypothetical protein
MVVAATRSKMTRTTSVICEAVSAFGGFHGLPGGPAMAKASII